MPASTAGSQAASANERLPPPARPTAMRNLFGAVAAALTLWAALEFKTAQCEARWQGLCCLAVWLRSTCSKSPKGASAFLSNARASIRTLSDEAASDHQTGCKAGKWNAGPANVCTLCVGPGPMASAHIAKAIAATINAKPIWYFIGEPSSNS